MPNQKLFLTILPAFLLAFSVFTSCVDRPADNFPPYDPTTETFIHQDWMDLNTRPGDSFWQFALGSWLTRENRPDDLFMTSDQNVKAAVGEYFLTSTDPLDVHLRGHFDKIPTREEVAQASRAYIDRDMKKADGTLDVYAGMARLARKGFMPAIAPLVAIEDRRFVYFLSNGRIPANCESRMYNCSESEMRENILSVLTKMLGPDEDFEQKSGTIVDQIYRLLELEMSPGTINSIRHPFLPCDSAVSLAEYGARTRADGLSLDGPTLCELFGLDATRDQIDQGKRAIYDMVADMDEEALYAYFLYNMYNFLIPATLGEPLNASTAFYKLQKLAPDAINNIVPKVLPQISHADACRSDLEDLRTVMGERIRSLTWMSDASKASALKKLAAMKFNVGSPDRSPFEDYYTLTGDNILEDALQMAEQHTAFYQRLVGQSFEGKQTEYLMQNNSLASVNAFYSPLTNELYILPAFCAEPFYPDPKSTSEVDLMTRLSILTVFGHEICHGFDANGVRYDEAGRRHKWLTEADQQKFQAKQQQLIDLMSPLEAYPGQNTNSVSTLTENMADMGGLRLALELFKQRLQESKLSPAEHAHQLREFCLAYASLWKQVVDPQYKENFSKYDTHCANQVRVDGQMRLLDEWYALFDVQPGDRLYVAPEDRPVIW